MTETADARPEPEPAPEAAADPARAAVEEVLASLQVLDDRPVAEHAAVFEQAHHRLRGLIDHAGDAPRADAAPPQA